MTIRSRPSQNGASSEERDVFGAQQQAEFILMSVPVLPETAALNGAV